jgi:DNA-binding response OmpR family regulator
MAKVLVVDDHPDVVRLIQVALEKEHEVLTAYNGEEALQVVAESQPDLVILDVMMPVLDGYRVLNRLREDAATNHLPVLMLTAKDEPHDIHLGLTLGADYYISKPFNPRDIAALVRHHLAASE